MKDDITKVRHYQETAKDFETRLALQRLLEILKSWEKGEIWPR